MPKCGDCVESQGRGLAAPGKWRRRQTSKIWYLADSPGRPAEPQCSGHPCSALWHTCPSHTLPPCPEAETQQHMVSLTNLPSCLQDGIHTAYGVTDKPATLSTGWNIQHKRLKQHMVSLTNSPWCHWQTAHGVTDKVCHPIYRVNT